jgi:hypothetical protein
MHSFWIRTILSSTGNSLCFFLHVRFDLNFCICHNAITELDFGVGVFKYLFCALATVGKRIRHVSFLHYV